MLSLQMLVSLTTLLLLSVVIVRPIVTYIRDPFDLRKFPAPSLLAAMTPLWIVRQTMTERRSRIIHEQHQRLGKVIRVAPRHLMFNDPQAIKEIYGMQALSRVAKDEFYDRLAGEHHDLVLVRNRGEHARRRKALTNAFALKTVLNMEPVIRDKTQQLLERIDMRCEEVDGGLEENKGFGSINIRRWFNLFTMDIIGDMAFGIPMGFLQKGDDSKEAETRSGLVYHVPSTIDSIHRGVLFGITLAEMGSHYLRYMTNLVLRAFPPLAYRLGSSAGDDFENICIHQLRKRIDKGPPARPSGDFMEFVLNGNQSAQPTTAQKSSSPIPFGELLADSLMMMNAGSETTAAALTSTIYHLLANPLCLNKLRNEIETKLPFILDEGTNQAVSAYSSIGELPYLRACIDETLRLRPPIAFQLPRVVYAPEGAMIAGFHIRQGTVVAVSPYSMHRNEELYQDPDTFNPDRWLDESDPEQLRRLKSYNIPFSQGSRACIGRHIAIVELQILISTLVRRYDMTLSSPDQPLEIFDRFNANPGPLPIRVKRRLPAMKSQNM